MLYYIVFFLTLAPKVSYPPERMVFSLIPYLADSGLMPGFTTPQGIFCSIAWVSTLLAFGTFALSLLGGADGDADVPDGADTGVFSMRAVVGFFLGFGWGGYMSLAAGMATMAAAGIAFVVGLVMFLLVAALMRAVYGLRSDGTISPESLVGLRGSVYVTIPPAGQPGGQVQLAHPNQLLTIAAVQMGDSPLPVQSRVVVVSAMPGVVTVRPDVE